MAEFLDRSVSLGEYVPGDDDDLIICRCEEISKGEIRKAVHWGMWTTTEVKRFLRCGMGLCQGLTCKKNVKAIIAQELGVSPSQLEESTVRPPNRPIELAAYGKEVPSK